MTLAAGAGCGSNEEADEFEDVTLEAVDDPIRTSFETQLRRSAEEDGDLTDAEITCVVSGTRDEIDDEQMLAAAQAQVDDPGSEISDDITSDIEKIADDCGVEFEAP